MPKKNKSLPITGKELKTLAPHKRIGKLFGDGPGSPLFWLLGSNEMACEDPHVAAWHTATAAVKKSKPLPKKVADNLLDELIATITTTNGQSANAVIAIRNLAAAHCLSVLTTDCDQPRTERLIEHLISQASQLRLAKEDSSRQLWIEQLLAVELPLTLAYQLPDVVVSEDLGQPAAEWMAAAVVDCLDDDGWPRADVLPSFGPLMASWARSLKLIDKLGLEFCAAAAGQLEWAVRQLLRLLRPDESLMFSGCNGGTLSMLQPECLKLLLSMSADREDQRLAKSTIRRIESKKRKQKKQAATSSISEWGESGILQAGWHRGSPKVCFDYSRESFAVEIGAARTLIVGQALPEISFDSQTATPIDGFEIVCNESDKDLDYVELQMALSPSLTLTRQLVLSRDEDFLLVADCVVPLVPGRIDYRCDWPLASGISLLAESETREVYLQDRKIQALVLPLSLPEWKVGRADGRMESIDGKLRMSQSINGAGLYVPLVFDLNPRRAKKKRTWRQLTVAEDRKPVPKDFAAAFRFQLDKQQWFFYRVVAEQGNRTFLGENFNGEFLISRFDRKGAVAEMLRIE